jgi:hypothetical protein
MIKILIEGEELERDISSYFLVTKEYSEIPVTTVIFEVLPLYFSFKNLFLHKMTHLEIIILGYDLKSLNFKEDPKSITILSKGWLIEENYLDNRQFVSLGFYHLEVIKTDIEKITPIKEILLDKGIKGDLIL